jgi:hypothetical protein
MRMAVVMVETGVAMMMMMTRMQVGRCMRWLVALVVVFAVALVSYAGLSERG